MVVMEDVKGQRKPDEISIRTDIGEETVGKGQYHQWWKSPYTWNGGKELVFLTDQD